MGDCISEEVDGLWFWPMGIDERFCELGPVSLL